MIHFSSIFLYGGCCFGGLWPIKETHPRVCTSLHSQHCSGRVYGTHSSNGEHQTILSLAPPLTTEATLASFWALLYGKWFSRVWIFQPLTIKWMDFNLWIFSDLQRKEGGASVTSISRTSTVCYYGNPCANAVSLAIYQGAGCHATIPCVTIKWIQTQIQLLWRTSGKAALDIAAHQSSNMLTA